MPFLIQKATARKPTEKNTGLHPVSSTQFGTTQSRASHSMTHNKSQSPEPSASPASEPNSPPASPAEFSIDALSPRQQRAVLVCDVVESVRWMEHDEDNAITRWSQFAAKVRASIAPEHQGRVVKSTGDGLMIEFEQAPQAVAAAHALQKLAQEGNQRLAPQDPEHQMHLRIGIHQAQIRSDSHDIYGHGVNLAARITTLAGPGEIIVTPEVRDHLTDSLDGDIEDMGECYLKHLSEPQRVYRVGSSQIAFSSVVDLQSDLDMSASIAVMPLDQGVFDPANTCFSDLIADGIICQLTRSANLRVISRLSTIALRGRSLDAPSIGKILSCRYVLSGSFLIHSRRVVVTVELSRTSDGEVFWSDRFTHQLEDLFDTQSEVISSISDAVHSKILQMEFQWMAARPMPNSDSYSLLISAITLMHRMSKKDFAWSEKILNELIHRHPRHPTPRSWLAKWHSLAIAQGWSSDIKKQGQIAHATVNAALEINNNDSLALTVKALLHGYVDKKFDIAEEFYTEAIHINPNESLAWIGRASVNTWLGNGSKAIFSAKKSLTLSPIDPLKYYYYSLAAGAMLIGNEYQNAIDLAKKSTKINAGLSSTKKVLTIAYMLNQQLDEAIICSNEILKIEPDFSISKFRNLSPLFKAPDGEIYVAALAQAGIPY
jgi:adenylate cyclase